LRETKASEDLRDKPHLPVCYAAYYGRAVERARELGWCLGLHGSLRRDCDIVAVPWIEGASDARALLTMIAEEFGGFLDERVAEKPFGRRAWTVHMGGPWVDISVIDPRMERRAKPGESSVEVTHSPFGKRRAQLMRSLEALRRSQEDL